jgi:dephospho-CoA kinase
MLQQIGPYAIKEAALIFESDAQKDLDAVIGVRAPLPLRIERIMQRDSIDEAAVHARMQKQMNEDEKMSRCNFVIENDEQQMLIPQVLLVHEKLLNGNY